MEMEVETLHYDKTYDKRQSGAHRMTLHLQKNLNFQKKNGIYSKSGLNKNPDRLFPDIK